MNSVLGGGFSGRLFQNLRERHGFTYGSSSFFDQKKLGGVFSATAEGQSRSSPPLSCSRSARSRRHACWSGPTGQCSSRPSGRAGCSFNIKTHEHLP